MKAEKQHVANAKPYQREADRDRPSGKYQGNNNKNNQGKPTSDRQQWTKKPVHAAQHNTAQHKKRDNKGGEDVDSAAMSTRSICGVPVADSLGANKLKSSIRNAYRLLKKMTNMPATERQDHERRLKANMALLEGRVLAEMERKHALRYKLVRFVERKKAVRRLRQAMRGVSGGNGSDSDESAKSDEESTKSDDEEMATQSVDEARLDVLYVMCHPRVIKYAALYATSDASAEIAPADQQSSSRKQQVRGALNAFFTAHPRLADRAITSVLAKSIDTPPTGTGTSSDALRDDIDTKVSAYLIHRLPWMAREIWTHTGEELRATYEMMGLKVEEVVKEKVAEAARVAPVGDDERKVHVPVAVNVSAGNSKAQKKRKQVVATAEVEDGGNDDDDDFFVGN